MKATTLFKDRMAIFADRIMVFCFELQNEEQLTASSAAIITDENVIVKRRLWALITTHDFATNDGPLLNFMDAFGARHGLLDENGERVTINPPAFVTRANQVRVRLTGQPEGQPQGRGGDDRKEHNPPPHLEFEGPENQHISCILSRAQYRTLLTSAFNDDAPTRDRLIELKIDRGAWALMRHSQWDLAFPNIGQQLRVKAILSSKGLLATTNQGGQNPATNPPAATPPNLLAARRNAQARARTFTAQIGNQIKAVPRDDDNGIQTLVDAAYASANICGVPPQEIETEHLVEWLALESLILRDSRHLETVPALRTRVGQKIRALEAALDRTPRAGWDPAEPVRTEPTHNVMPPPVYTSLLDPNTRTNLTGQQRIIEFCSARNKISEAWDGTQNLRNEVKSFASMSPHVLIPVGSGCLPSIKYVAACERQYISCGDVKSGKIMLEFNHLKTIIRKSEERAAADEVGSYTLGYVAAIGCVRIARGDFRERFQTAYYPTSVAPAIWQLANNYAMDRLRFDRLQLSVSDAKEFKRLAKESKFFESLRQHYGGQTRNRSEGSRGGGGGARVSENRQGSGGGSGGGAGTFPSTFRLGTDTFTPTPNPLDRGVHASTSTLRVNRAYYKAVAAGISGNTNVMPECKSCGLRHSQAQTCHIYKAPAFRSPCFRHGWKIAMRIGLLNATENDEWNGRPGRLQRDKIGVSGKFIVEPGRRTNRGPAGAAVQTPQSN